VVATSPVVLLSRAKLDYLFPISKYLFFHLLDDFFLLLVLLLKDQDLARETLNLVFGSLSLISFYLEL
jgi:hypothetical protein